MADQTRVEDADERARPTRREDPTNEQYRPFRVTVPPILADSYEEVQPLRGGGEGVLVLARHKPTGELRVIKVYTAPGERRDQAAFEAIARSRLSSAGHDHLVDIWEFSGPGEHYPWEVMEYCDPGSLADLIISQGPQFPTSWITRVLEELVPALEYLHNLSIPHRDLTPKNILVRSLGGLDLVLADFGLARQLALSREYHSRINTAPYAPPETSVSPAMDWWALGIIAAELALGHHPFEINGYWVDDRVIFDHIRTKDLPLHGIHDPRVTQLCLGLTRRDPDRRWNGSQIRRWLAGENPDVAAQGADQTASEQARPKPAVTPFNFTRADGRTESFSDPVALARAMASRWDDAAGLLEHTSARRGEQRALKNFLHSVGLEEAVAIIDENDRHPNLEEQLSRLLLALEPSLPPTFRGHVVDRDGLLALSRAKQAAYPALATLFAQPILNNYAANPKYAYLAADHGRWQDAMSSFTRLLDASGMARISSDRHEEMRAKLLEAVLDAKTDRDLQVLGTRAAADAGARRHGVFAQFVDSNRSALQSTAAGALVAYMLQPLATKLADERDLRDERAREAEQAKLDAAKARAARIVELQKQLASAKPGTAPRAPGKRPAAVTETGCLNPVFWLPVSFLIFCFVTNKPNVKDTFVHALIITGVLYVVINAALFVRRSLYDANTAALARDRAAWNEREAKRAAIEAELTTLQRTQG